MPSLRRSASSPAVRPAPYSSSLAVARGNGHRRSSGSETSSRRVLADIEWWRVTEGQCDLSAGQPSDDDQVRGVHGVDVLDVAAAASIVIVDVDAPTPASAPTALPWIAVDAPSDETPAALTLPTEFSGLSITPHTPTRRHHALESLSSSLESTPETAFEDLAHGVSELDLGFFETAFLPPLASQRQHRFEMLSPMFLKSYGELNDEHPTTYADFAVSPLSSAPRFLN